MTLDPSMMFFLDQRRRLEIEARLNAARQNAYVTPWEYTQDVAELLYTLSHLLDRLPSCEECGKSALYMLVHGPYYCEKCAQPHPTAQKVAWYEELKRLGVTSDS